FRISQAVASSITGHPHWGLTATLGLADLPMAAGAPGVTLLVFLRLRRLAGLGALATAIGQIAAGAVPAFAGYADPAVAFTVLVSVAAACLRAPVSRRVLALLAIPVIPYAFLWQEKLAVDLFGQPGGGSAIISSSIPLLYLPPLLLACLILFGTWLARRRAGE